VGWGGLPWVEGVEHVEGFGKWGGLGIGERCTCVFTL